MTTRFLGGAALAATLFLLLIPSAAADEWGEGNARASLVASAKPGSAGEPLMLGVRFDIKPGWHIYWRYPGDAGLATDIRWRLPDSWSAGPLLWPTPISFTQSGDLAGYGYEDRVVLASEVAFEAAAGAASVGAVVDWLACKDVCVIGSAELEAAVGDIPVDPDFESWHSTLPSALSASQPPFGWRTTGGFDNGRLSLWLQWQGAAPSVEWYPNPPEAIEVKNVRVSSLASLTRIDASVRRRAGAGVQDKLSSLVVVTAADGSRRGWELELVIEE
jgi:thiol:disulfide interchange protein DsbD